MSDWKPPKVELVERIVTKLREGGVTELPDYGNPGDETVIVYMTDPYGVVITPQWFEENPNVKHIYMIPNPALGVAFSDHFEEIQKALDESQD